MTRTGIRTQHKKRWNYENRVWFRVCLLLIEKYRYVDGIALGELKVREERVMRYGIELVI